MIIIPLLPSSAGGWLGMLIGGLFAIVGVIVVVGALLHRFSDDCWM